MSELQRVSFRKPVQHLPRLSAPYVPGRKSDRFWTDEELAIVKKYFPIGGNLACLAHLGPHRTPAGVYNQASKMKLSAPKGTASDITAGKKAAKLKAPDGFDDRLRAFYLNGDGKKRGECNAFADREKMPRWWVSKRAITLGLVIPHKKEPPWVAAELELLKKVPLHDIFKCANIFREHGFQRTPMSIKVKATRLHLSRRYKETLSCTGAARILGVDMKTLLSEIIGGRLAATKRKTDRLPQQGGDWWSIERPIFRQYIIDHIERIDFRKVNKLPFIDILVGFNDAGAAPQQKAAKPDGRKKPWSQERRAAQSKRMRVRWKRSTKRTER